MITPFRGKFHVEFYPKVASTAFAQGDLVYIDSNGYLAKMTATTDQSPLGLIQKTVAATDSDYASNTRVPVQIGDSNAEYLCDVSTGTAAQTDVGEWVDIDDENSIDVDAVTYQIFFVTKFISTSQVVAKMSQNDPRPASIVD